MGKSEKFKRGSFSNDSDYAQNWRTSDSLRGHAQDLDEVRELSRQIAEVQGEIETPFIADVLRLAFWLLKEAERGAITQDFLDYAQARIVRMGEKYTEKGGDAKQELR